MMDWHVGDETGMTTGLVDEPSPIEDFSAGGSGSGIDGGGESGGRDDEAEDEGRFTGFGVDGGELGPAGGASQLGSGRKNNVLRPDDECERRECGGDVSNWPPKLDKNASLMTMGLTVVRIIFSLCVMLHNVKMGHSRSL